MKVTLQSVADALGVSRSTVSNAYSRPDQLSPQLRERILATARQLGYAGPHPSARSLRRGRAGAIGVLFTVTLSYAFTDPYAVQFLRGLAESAEQHDTGLLLVPLPMSDAEAAARAVQEAAVDGFCIYCLPEWHPARPAVGARHLPTVTTDVPPQPTPNDAFVGINEAGATRAAGELLTQLGHRRIAVIVDWEQPTRRTAPSPLQVSALEEVDDYDTRERLRGYREALSATGTAAAELTVVNAAANSRPAGEAAAGYLLDRLHRPTAVVAVTDMLALGVLDALAIRGLWPGRDVSVIGFDDLPEAEVAGLTTIRQDPLLRGQLAGRILLDPPAEASQRQVLLPTELVVRATTGPAPSGEDR